MYKASLDTDLFFGLLLFVFSGQLVGQSHIEVAQSVGVTTQFGSGIFGGGISFVDFNNDGWDDLSFATEEGKKSRFFINNEGQFTEIDLGLNDLSQTKQILWVDIDNDGDKDLYTSNFNAPNRLYINDGHLGLTDETATFNLPIDNEPSFGAAFGDYNKDGYLDLYVVNRDNTAAITNHLYESKAGKAFDEVSLATCTSDPFKVPFCASFIDINNNLWPDIYIASDRFTIENTMLKNLGTNKFQDISSSSGTNISIDAMNVGIGDPDGDGDLDIYVTNTAGIGGSVFLSNNGNETFSNATVQNGLTWLETGWGGNFFDYDNDCDEDLYVCNGFGGADKYNALFDNVNSGEFELPTGNQLQGDTFPSYSNAIGDLNNDGLLDIAVSHEFDFPHQIWQNQLPDTNNWLKVDLQGVSSNRDGIGSWIEVFINDQRQVRYTTSAIGYLAQNSSSYHFGIGSDVVIDSLVVRWINGHEDRLYDLNANQKIRVVEFSSMDCPSSLILTNQPIPPNIYRSKGYIKTGSTVNEGLVSFNTRDSVVLSEHFGILPNATFQIILEECLERN